MGLQRVTLITVICAWLFLLIWIQFWDQFALFCGLCTYFSDYAWSWFFRVLIADWRVSSQVFGEKHKVGAKPSQERLQKKPNRPNTGDPRQVSWSKAKHQNAAFGKWENGAGSRHHRQPVVFTTVRGGGRTVVLPRTHNRASPLLPSFFHFPLQMFVFLRGFSICAMFHP